jgi:molecular chaperone DnaJ
MESDRAADKDFYGILGVTRSADAAAIDTAYRDLVRHFHPDLGTSTPESLARIKLINEAYSVLSDSRKRREYDRRHGPRRSIFLGTPASPGTRVGAGVIPLELPIAPEEAACGGPCQFTLTTWPACGDCSGAGETQGAACASCQGRGQIPQQRALCIQLPPGLRTGEVLRVASQDICSPWGVADLLLKISVRPCW